MSLTRDWSQVVGSMQREMDRFVTDFAGRKPPPVTYSPRPWQPSVDCFETAEEITVVIELPGMKADEIEVSVQGRILTVRGERQDPRRGVRRSYQLMEIAWGPFERQLELPAAVDSNAIKAAHGDGMLEIIVPWVAAADRQLIVKG